jgi:hypothetical protein
VDAGAASRGGQPEAVAPSLDEGRADERRERLHTAAQHADVDCQLARGTREGRALGALDAGAQLRERSEVIEEISRVDMRCSEHRAKDARKPCRTCL